MTPPTTLSTNDVAQSEEGAADRGDDRRGRRRGRAVVDEALALDDRDDSTRHAEPLHDRRRRDRVGGGDDGAEHERGRPREPGHDLVRDDGDDDHRQQHEPDGEQPDRPQVRPQVAQRGEERGAVEERRQDPDEDEVGRQVDLGQPGTKPSASPPSTSRIGYGIRSFGTSTSIAAPAASSTSRLTRSCG